MIDMEINKVLTQMRSIEKAIAQPEPAPEAGGADFGNAMLSAIEKVNEQSQAASHMVADFESGASTANVADVMVAMQKASISFQAMTEVRNKLVDAYQQIMNMPI